MAESDGTTTPPGSSPPGSLNPDLIGFARDAVHALRADRHSGALHVAAVLDLLSERLGSRAEPNVMAGIGIVLAIVGAAMTAEALKLP
jgi:hypothetical protein